ncbi:MAG: hypothetical protein DMF94_15955 [Acidobacteria bacterium]|nr:MAG: hypothetical protein DMF94_15955 [Acidobacteriota bacterium]
MRTVFADLRYAFRVASRTPSFAVAVVGVLALGIGANTAIFSIVNAVLLRPLPFEEPERLVRIFTRTPGGRLFELSPGKFYDWQRDAQSFEGMALYQCCGFRELALTGTGTARTVRATAVSAGFFEIVRARPALGRVIRQEEDTPGGKYVVVLSDRFWRTEFGGHPDVIGRTVKLSDEAYTIVGVMPATASVASWTGMASDVWIPLALTDEQRAARGNHNRYGVVRLKRDVELAQAQAEMDAISARLAREFPQTDGRGWEAVVIPMQEEIVGNSRTMLLMLLGGVGLVLLIACANVGNLLFTRALSRRKEIAIRFALGAARGRVFQQLLTEALLLAVAGGVLGLLLAYGTLTSASTLLASQVPRAEEISIDSAARHTRTACYCRDSRDRSRAAGRRYPDDAGGARRATGVPAVKRAAARSLRRSRAAARRSGSPQRPLVYRARTQPRDRDQTCAWRAESRRPSAGDRRGHVTRARRHRGRNNRRARVGEGD